MLCRTGLVCLTLLSVLVLPPARASARPGGDPQIVAPADTVSGVGFVTVKERPALVRMTIQLSEKAESLKDALDQLKDRREAALQQLQSLGAKQDTIVAEPPTLPSDNPQQRQQMEQVVRGLRAQGRSIPKGLEQPAIVTVTSQLTAEWPLDMATHEEVLMFVKDLKDKVVAADLAGINEAKKLSPEAQELEEEMAEARSGSGYGEEETNPGEPQFFYVARLSEAACDQALAEAFARAQAHAARLAKAAGAQLGTLSSLSGWTDQLGYDSDAYYGGRSLQMRMMFAQQAQQTGAKEPTTEAIVSTPTMATFQVTVQANFRLKSEVERRE